MSGDLYRSLHTATAPNPLILMWLLNAAKLCHRIAPFRHIFSTKSSGEHSACRKRAAGLAPIETVCWEHAWTNSLLLVLALPSLLFKLEYRCVCISLGDTLFKLLTMLLLLLEVIQL